MNIAKRPDLFWRLSEWFGSAPIAMLGASGSPPERSTAPRVWARPAAGSARSSQAHAARPRAVGDDATEEALRQAQDEVQRLSTLLISIQEDERRRIALDLHDDLGQVLTLLKLSIDKSARLFEEGATSEAGACLRQLQARANEALGDVRRVAAQLRPAILDDLGILPTLSWFFREFDAARTGIALDRTIGVTAQDVPVTLHTPVFRIVQEALNNVVKHSAADHVRFRFDRVGNGLRLQIEDNGRGFDPRAIRCSEGHTRGLGLFSMRERASASGGRYHLQTALGQGTSIRVCWLSAVCPERIALPPSRSQREPDTLLREGASRTSAKNTVHRV